jgi:hypothetical protein
MVTQNSRTFPATPQKMAMELFVNSAWTDITDDVRWSEGCNITRGRPNESSLLTPGNCSFVLKNTTGRYSPRNPLGAYFGSIGRNTPMRLSLVAAQDTFTRTVSNGWGSTDDGWAWTCSGGSASDFAVTGSAATMTHTAHGVAHFASLQSLTVRDVDVSYQVSCGVASITGSSLYTGVRVRSNGTTYYQFSLILPAGGGTPQVNLQGSDGTVLIGLTGIPRLTYAANTPIAIRVQSEGQIFRIKAWMPNTQSEPQGWDAVTSEGASLAVNNFNPVGSYATIYTSTDPSNTNATPITFTLDNVAVRVPRFAGEVSEWPQNWDGTLQYAYVPVTASGPLRRLSAGGGPLDSAARRYIALQAPYAYWPLEDGASTIAALNFVGGVPMQAIQAGNNGVGTVKWAQDSTLIGSGPAPVLTQGSQLYAWTDPTPSTTAWAVAFCARITRTSGTTVIFSGAGPFQVSMNINTDSTCSVYVTLPSGSTNIVNIPADITGADFIDGKWHSYVITCTQSGATLTVTATRDGGDFTGTMTATMLPLAQLVFPTPATADQFGFAHVAVWGADVGSSVRQGLWSSCINGWASEVALNRMIRLCAEEGVEFGWNTPTDRVLTPAMGPQRQQTLVQLLQECASTDTGELTESRGSFGLHFHHHASVDNRPATTTLSLSSGQVAPPFQPIDDDQSTRNSVTVTAPDGSSYRYQKTSGALSIQAPPNGAGEYDATATANAYYAYVIRNIAAWLVGLGTVDKPRYSALRTNRANNNVVVSGWSGPFGQLLAVDLMDKVTVTGMAPSGLYDDAELTVVGIVELLHTQRHELAFICLPEEPRHVGVVANAASPASTDSRMDTGGSQLALGYTSSATSLSVQTSPNTQLWTTAAGDFPFDIIVGGERMTVTNITGSSSPQTFTVTRSVNGVVKAQGALTDVRLFKPCYVGL